MDRDLTRRALLAGVLGGGVGAAALSPAASYLERFAPFTGSVWRSATSDVTGTVESPYGDATVRFDEWGVPNVTAESERALHYALGYAHAGDRLFQMDLFRRQMRGELSAVFGERAIDSDVFNTKMDFAGAAEATWAAVEDTEAGTMVETFAEGVNEFVESKALPVEFELLGYEPDPWRPEDTALMEKQIGWGLTGSFQTLRRARIADAFSPERAASLYPGAGEKDHDSPIIRGEADGGSGGQSVRPHAVDGDAVDWLSGFEWPDGIGSNSWVISGTTTNDAGETVDQTADGAPIVANDPHLSLMVPPIWYEQNCTVEREGRDRHVRGVTFPGVPFVVIGQNLFGRPPGNPEESQRPVGAQPGTTASTTTEATATTEDADDRPDPDGGAWGITNGGADVIDFYTYETVDGGSAYRYRGETREFETEEVTITVADAEDRTVTVKKSVHGPVIGGSASDDFDEEYGVQWVGSTGTRTADAVYRMNKSRNKSEFEEAMREFDLPHQNLVYADWDDNTLYRLSGKVPFRYTDGERVPGNRVFDGSAGEGEWRGFTPFGQSSWEGFVPFEEMPHVDDPDYVGTANQRILDDPDYYLAETYSDPFRGIRLYDLLDGRAEADQAFTREFSASLQRDTYDERAPRLVPTVLDVRDELPEAVQPAVDALADWNYLMDRGSEGALYFALFVDEYRKAVFETPLREGLGEESVEQYYPGDWVLVTLSADSPWFSDRDRASVIGTALSRVVDRVDEAGYETYGDYNRIDFTHPFDRSWLNYGTVTTDGAPSTLNNAHAEGGWGSSWRMLCPQSDRVSRCVVPGGNSGRFGSDHYKDQLRRWADGEYKDMLLTTQGDVGVRFVGADSDDGGEDA